jgi:hypothetical protein
MAENASSRAADPAAATSVLEQEIVADDSNSAINGQAAAADPAYGA